MCAFWTADAKTSRASTSKDLQMLIQASESRVRTYAAAKSVRRLHDTLKSMLSSFLAMSFAIVAHSWYESMILNLRKPLC